MRKLAKAAYKFLLKGSSTRVVAPPGDLDRLTKGCPVIVASFPRSGTHLMIDTLLNNFQSYKSNPLYVDFDQMSNPAYSDEALKKLGSYQVVIKTHYPHKKLFTHGAPVEEALEKLISESFIIRVERDSQAIIKSYQKGFSNLDNLEREIEQFEDYWSQKADFTVSFDQLTNPSEFQEMLPALCEAMGSAQPRKLKSPPCASAFYRVGIQKLFTRLLGSRSPFSLNTTIQFKN